SKEILFRDVIQYAFEMADTKYPVRGDLKADAPAQDRLRAFMTAMIQRIFDPGPAGQFDRIMSHACTRFDGPHDLIKAEVTRLQGHLLDHILEELLGDVSPTEKIHARFNIIALCVFANVVPHLRQVLFSESPTQEALQEYINHQLDFALAGLSAMRKASPGAES
ncbi:MAG: hypothetical protein AAF492_15655, partial [Verrucomicrobiota bacterium]